ncbi:hypothetical protein PM082_015064 [Marasmius tenuissimus]|nr:hypothetical protein PM082_015064 [Marasmius tenuissimus]
MEADNILEFLSPLLPNLISHLCSLRPVSNNDFMEKLDPEHMCFLLCQHPIIPCEHHISRLSSNRSKGERIAILNHTLFLLTRSTISKSVLQSWKNPLRIPFPPSTQPHIKDKNNDKDHNAIEDFTSDSSKAEQANSPIEDDGSGLVLDIANVAADI